MRHHTALLLFEHLGNNYHSPLQLLLSRYFVPLHYNIQYCIDITLQIHMWDITKTVRTVKL
jgi:hypothetical protein